MGRTVVTGANRGIGLELVRQLRDAGADVVGACRRSSEALEATGASVCDGVDVASDDGVARLAAFLDGADVDVLINNAGILQRDGGPDGGFDFDAMRRSLEINAIGPLRVTAALRPNLKRGSKVAIVTSRMGSIGDGPSGGAYGYRMSKSAVNMAGANLAADLRGAGVAVAILHPGFVRTEMTGSMGQVDAPFAARGLLARIGELSLETSGGFWHAQGEPLPW